MLLEKIINAPDETALNIEYLKKSDLPLVMYGAGIAANHIHALLLRNNLQINHVIVDDEFYTPNTYFNNHLIEQKSNVLDGHTEINVIIASPICTSKIETLSKNPFAARCISFDFPPYYFNDYYNMVKEHISELETFYFQLADDHSRNLMIAYINAKISKNPMLLHNFIIDGEQQYFPEFLILEDNEVFVDMGAFDGDTVKRFIDKVKGNYSKIYAFEPDKQNIKKLKRNISKYNNIEIIEKGCFSCNTTLHFKSDAGTSSSISEEGSIEVDVEALDNVVSEKVTFIKIDIEGAELEALKGAQNTIRTNHPKLAICVYHRPEDIWTIPQYINKFYTGGQTSICDTMDPIQQNSFSMQSQKGNENGYKYYLRYYGSSSLELVFYAVPID